MKTLLEALDKLEKPWVAKMKEDAEKRGLEFYDQGKGIYYVQLSKENQNKLKQNQPFGNWNP